MNIKLIDVQNSILGIAPGTREFVSGPELIAEMDKCQVEKSVCSLLPDDLEPDYVLSNNKLYEECAASGGRLLPCPIIVPRCAANDPDEDTQVSEAINAGAPMMRIRCIEDNWEIMPWISYRLFYTMQSRRMPLVVTEALGYRQIGEIAEAFPGLPVIVRNLSYSAMRKFLPLLKTFGNTCLSIGNNFTFHCGIELLVREVGAERLLFGSGFPRSEMMSAITQLMYSDIADECKALIGSENFERLAGEIN